ncbi:MAG: ATP-dependent RNA helicase [Deltaproteobacteria bacterium]|nr:ATP-dependent RNA helicase [Deltaproteobacteria bacterium]
MVHDARVKPDELPIHAVRAAFDAALSAGPVVVSSPTGSGKSTEVPRWATSRGRVLVVEPRRVACRSLASRVAELEGTPLGTTVGYAVRDESVSSEATRILFATPGVVLHARDLASRFETLVLDEFHERSLDLDLLLSLFAGRPSPRLVVMSATIDGDRVARHLGAVHVTAGGRAYPVDVRHLDPGPSLPHADELASRVARAVEAAADDPGDVLVFLPGKAEIDACARALRSNAFEVIPLHGGLSLDEQRRGFERTARRKLILATNVAETSITLPGVGVVIDAGLVRRTRYHAGRGFLALGPIAQDSAAQRTGRAGRTGPGVCYRLWGRVAMLERATPPEIHRESLVPLVLGAAAWGRRVDELALFDPPKAAALDAAREELTLLGAIDSEGALTPRGHELYGLPLDPPLARLLIEARGNGSLDDVIDLVSALAVGRPLFLPGGPGEDDELRRGECDATALIRAVRDGREREDGLSYMALGEARRIRARLRRAHGLGSAPTWAPIDREALVRTAIAADPRSVHVARVRGRSVAFSNGGTELELARESLAQRVKDLDAIVVFESRALGVGQDARVLVTCASPVPLATVARAGLGRDRLDRVQLERGVIVAHVERVYANRVIATREETPSGELAREAIATLFLRGSLFKQALPVTRDRLALSRLAVKLGHAAELAPSTRGGPTIEAWVAARLVELGVEGGDDLALLSSDDLLAPEVPSWVRDEVERDHPRTVSVGDAMYEADYDLDRRRVTLRLVRGQRRDPPPLQYLPRFAGLGIVVEGPRGATVLRG